jgi:peroxisomal membrane protein 2
MCTQGSLSALTEIVASYFAYARPGYGPAITSRVPKMAFYGACVAAPLTHFLNTMVQKQFPGKILLQQIITMLFVRPCLLLTCIPRS